MTEHVIDADFEQTRDSIIAMTSVESSPAYVVHDYLARLMMESPTEQQERRFARRRPRSSLPSEAPFDELSPPVDAPCRYLMATWCNSLCDFCQYPRDLTASAMSCVDRFVATSAVGYEALLDRDLYQLVVMAAFYTAAKVHQMEALDPKSVARLSRGKHTTADVEEMERTMLTDLGWRVNPPTTRFFAHHLLQLIPDSLMDRESRRRITELADFQLDLAICYYDLSLHRPSQIAYGALLNAIESIDGEFAARFEAMVSTHVLSATHNVDVLREIRIGLLRAVAEDPSAAEPTMSALLTKQLTSSSLGVVKPVGSDQNQLGSSIGIDTSPRSVSSYVLDH